MKNNITALYIGYDDIVPKYLAEHEGYLVNAVNPKQLGHIKEFKYDISDKIVARDTLEGDARLIMMDVNMLDGVKQFSSLIDKMLQQKIKGESLDIFWGDIEDSIKEALKLHEDKIKDILIDENGNPIPFDIAKGKNKYLEFVKSIMDSVNYRVILGDKKYQFLIDYIEQMKNAALERRVDSRLDTGDARDLLEETEQHWKPMVVLTSSQELAEVTNGENVRTEYQQLYLMQKVMEDLGIKIDIPAVINVRSEYDVKLEANVLKGIAEARDKIREIIEKKKNGEKIEASDKLSNKILNIINGLEFNFNNISKDVETILDILNITDILGIADIEKLTSTLGRLEKITDRNTNKEVKPMLLVVGNEEENDLELEEFQIKIIKRLIEELDCDLENVEITTKLTSENARSTIAPQKIVTAIKWLDLFANPNNNKNININEALNRALNMMDVLDVDGSVMGHSLRTSLLMGDFLNFMDKNMDWKSVEQIIPEQSIDRYRIDSKDIDDMMMGAYFHDVGKLLNIEDQDVMTFAASLQTNSSWGLSDSAQASIKHHAEVGSNTIDYLQNNFSGKKRFLDYAKKMALYHQEFVNDYSASPKGYSEDGKHSNVAIPLEAQYMMIIDVFDAIVSKRNYNKNTTLEETIEILTQQGGIKILQEDENNPGKYIPAELKRWCITSNIKFEIEEGSISKETLHFNPVLLKGFCDYLKQEVEKEKSFIKFENDTVKRPAGTRKVVTAIGSKGFEKKLIHREAENKSYNVKNIEEEVMMQKVKEFNKLLNSINTVSRGKYKTEIADRLKQLRSEIEENASHLGRSMVNKIMRSLDGEEKAR